MKYLLVIDMQNDFISQALGTPEAPGIVEPVCRLIRGFDGDVIYTRDTHRENYLETQEGGKLPVPHCIEGTAGWQICDEVAACMSPGAAVVDKTTFGAYSLPKILLEKSGGRTSGGNSSCRIMYRYLCDFKRDDLQSGVSGSINNRPFGLLCRGDA